MNESIDVSDFEVGHIDPPNNQPFTINPNQCGDLGLYIHMTPKYLLDENVGNEFGPYEKVTKYRW